MMNMAIADMLRRQVGANKSQLMGGDATQSASRTHDITKIDPLRFRAVVREICEFKIFNTGTTMAYIGVSVLRHRLQLDTRRTCDYLVVLPTSYRGGPGVNTAGVPLTGITSNGRTYVFGWTIDSNDVPLPPGDAFEQSSWDMNRAWFGNGSAVPGSEIANLTGFVRPYHAKQQFYPFVFDTTWWNPQYQTENYNGVTGGHFGPNIPFGLTSIVNPTGTDPTGLFGYHSSYNATTSITASTEMSNASAFDVFTVPVYPGPATIKTGYNSLPQYNEHRKGPFDRIFKRKCWRIQLAPRQCYTLRVKGRKMVINPLQHGFFKQTWFWKDNDVTTNANYISLPGQQWNNTTGVYTGLSYNCVEPPWVYGLKSRNPTTFVSFSFRGQTAVTATGWAANRVNEAGPAQCIIKRRYRAWYKGFLTRPQRMRTQRTVRNIGIDPEVDPTLYRQMNPTAPPVASAFSGIVP